MKIIQEIPYPEHLSKALLEQWMDTLPKRKKDDPNNPEWRPTPIKELDLTPFGYDALIGVKDESNDKSNPTSTIKDRKAHEQGPVFYRVFTENFRRQRQKNALIPRFTEITAGNGGIAQAIVNEKYGLPPPKLLMDITTPKSTLEKLIGLYADIYLADLLKNEFTGDREPYTPEQIKKLTRNKNGHDLTSTRVIPLKDYYDWHVHEAFNFFQKPGQVYIPFGSGELFANYLFWQKETAYNFLQDVRLHTKTEIVTKLNILAAEPERIYDSKADKLTGRKPFLYFKENDIRGMSLFHFTGRETGVYHVPEKRLKEAHHILSQFFNCEISACAGLALFLQKFGERAVEREEKILIVNTGRGI